MLRSASSCVTDRQRTGRGRVGGSLHESLVLSRHGINYDCYGFAFINSWILAKVMLIAESLDTHPHWRGRP
ncbi:hypothetical protein Mnod_4870 [Methylobacterium nodulans ORS 2060]|uniref:Uncharacterized protein n=1 Tax=Methylobacterium nodulans (strain LMG 21967 / CNCM I-2342 / ORS 2060) TaxID=460265 RepID=B8IH38_METNO|nr:hypothetical protein Mnod_4870 [Methylobacterium nodulans ORS 2060]